MQALFAVGGMILVFALLKMVVAIAGTIEVNRLVQAQIVVDLRSQVFHKLQHLSFRFFDAGATGSIINRVTGDVQAVRSFVDGVVLPLMAVGISLVFYLYYMLHIHVALTMACLATTPVLWVMAIRFSRMVRPAYQRNRELVDKMILRLAETIQGIAVVKCFARDKDELARFEVTAENVRTQQQWIFRRVSIFTPTIGFLTQVNLFILLLYGGWLVMHGEIPLGTGLVVFASLLGNFSAQVNQMAQISNTMQQCLTGARRVFEVLDTEVEIVNKPGAIRITRATGDIHFENVSFSYRDNSSALHGVSFHAPQGSLTAILGATGSGKSALLSLLPRFYDPTAGRILLDGVDLRELDLSCLRRQVGIVFQESFLFSTSIADNIAFGNPDATRDQIENAAKIARAHEFIMDQPEGYDAHLHESGSNLSGGQRQRLAIARALLLEPRILLLDDPTSAIDPQTEHEILDAMGSAMRGRTTFVVAHRLSTLRRADHVLVLDKGRILESGSHEELMAARGLYHGAISAQLPGEDLIDPPSQRSDHE
jgi:ATP-binding cassette subfamily B protein